MHLSIGIICNASKVLCVLFWCLSSCKEFGILQANLSCNQILIVAEPICISNSSCYVLVSAFCP